MKNFRSVSYLKTTPGLSIEIVHPRQRGIMVQQNVVQVLNFFLVIPSYTYIHYSALMTKINLQLFPLPENNQDGRLVPALTTTTNN